MEENCNNCCHGDICGYIDFNEPEEEACVGCCCGDGGECYRSSGYCSNYEKDCCLG